MPPKKPVNDPDKIADDFTGDAIAKKLKLSSAQSGSATPGETATWLQIGHANNVVTMAGCAGRLFAATLDNRLWWRDPVGQDIVWQEIGEANEVVAMAATSAPQVDRPAGLYAATRDNRLWWREPVPNVHWTAIGHANDVFAMAMCGGTLFAATRDDRFWTRPASGGDIEWRVIGSVPGLVAVTGFQHRLIAVGHDDRLWWREASLDDARWSLVVVPFPVNNIPLPESKVPLPLSNVVAIAVASSKLFAATRDNKLFWLR